MIRSNRILLYFAGYSAKFIGTGLVIIGLGFAATGMCCGAQARREG